MALTADQVQKFYIGYYARPADPVGLTYWQTQDEAAALKGFSESAEFTSQFTGLSASQQVTKVYNNLLGRAPDTAGLLYWAGELTAGRETIGSLVLSMIKNALGKDVTTIEDRVTYSNSFTKALDTAAEINAYAGATATQTARDALLKVVATAVGDHTALTAETAKIDATIATIVSGGGAAPGQTFTLTAGLDFADTSSAFMNGAIPSTFKFTSANEKVQALDGTFNATDVLQDGSTTDTDVLEVRVTTPGNLGVAPTVKNIENINVVMTNAGAAGTLSLLNFTGAKTITLTGSATTAGVNNFADAGVTKVDASGVTAGAITITPTANTTNALTLLGGAGADVINGSAGDDTISGGAGNDTLNGGAGNNTINGDAGNDTITAGNGTNTINGGAGDDTVTVGSGNNTIDMGAGANETVTAGNGNNTVTSAGATLNTITLGGGANTVTISGSGASAITIAGNGANTVTGGSGIDTVTINGAGSNTITTGAGADVITITAAAGVATNTITAGAGADVITLAAAATIVDKLVFGATDSGATLATADQVTNFLEGVDSLNFGLVAGDSVNYVEAGAAAKDYAAALSAADAFFVGATGAAAGVRYYVTDATDSDGAGNAGAIVFIDRNGDGVSDQSVVLVGQAEANLTFNDIVG